MIKNIITKAYNHKYSKYPLRISYLVRGKKPWTLGYLSSRNEFITKTLESDKLMQSFKTNINLPVNFGFGFDERVVEYPWIISHLEGDKKRILDAGSTMNHDFILKDNKVNKHEWLIATLDVESQNYNYLGISYLYGRYADLRNMCVKDNTFDYIVSCSVLEHVGMDNSFIYTKNKKYAENRLNDYLKVMDEFKRVLNKEGKIMITVPFGKYQNLGWLQQFDSKMLKKLTERSQMNIKITFYKYDKSGWQLSTESECRNYEYFDIHNESKIDSNNTAAARAVACIFLNK